MDVLEIFGIRSAADREAEERHRRENERRDRNYQEELMDLRGPSRCTVCGKFKDGLTATVHLDPDLFCMCTMEEPPGEAR